MRRLPHLSFGRWRAGPFFTTASSAVHALPRRERKDVAFSAVRSAELPWNIVGWCGSRKTPQCFAPFFLKAFSSGLPEGCLCFLMERGVSAGPTGRDFPDGRVSWGAKGCGLMLPGRRASGALCCCRPHVRPWKDTGAADGRKMSRRLHGVCRALLQPSCQRR